MATVTALTVKTLTMSPIEQIKARLMRQIERYGWDPYSANMTIDEFYALMELFDEGKLPLKKQTTAYADDNEGENHGGTDSPKNLIIPREKFFLVGLPNDLAAKEDTVIGDDDVEKEILDQPLIYEYNNNYEPYDPYTNQVYKVGKEDGEFILNDKTYKLNADDGRLYDESVTIKTYQFAFESEDKVTYVMNNDEDDENDAYPNEGFVVYEATYGTQVPLSSLNGKKLTSLSTGAVYIVEGGGIYEYNTETEKSGNAFDEVIGEYFVINNQTYVWGNNALRIPGIESAPCDAIKALSYRYPKGYGLSNSGYMRPPKDWEGVKVEDAGDVQTVLVKKGINDDRYDIAGDVDQSVFQGDWNEENKEYEHGILYNGYYIKQITIDGANVNILGIIRVPETGRLVYYYLSAEEQDWQVSTTTLREEDKFLIEYTPNEYKVEYQVLMADKYTAGMNLTKVDESLLVSDVVPKGVVMYGSNTATTLSWVDSIFGTTASRPARTTDGAYSFDVLVPYGYEVQIFISVDRTISGTFVKYNSSTREYEDIPDIAKNPTAEGAIPYTFHVDIEHTSSRQNVEDTWLKGYRDYLIKYGIIAENANFDDLYEKKVVDGRYVYTWKDSEDPNADVHNGVFEIMAERINDIQMHNSGRNRPESGYPLGMYPKYEDKSKFNVLPKEDDGPEMLTLNDTFYNHLVKANRMITAVLKPLAAPTFDVSQILQKSEGAGGRGASANVDWAFKSTEYYGLDEDGNALDLYDADYLFHAARGNTDVNMSDDPLSGHGSVYPNINNINNSWGWNSETNAGNFKADPQAMRYDDKTGTYYYTWIFQTNSGMNASMLDAFEVNGISLTVPFVPKYNWNNSYDGGVKYDEKHPYFTETTLQDGAVVTLEFLLGWNAQRIYRVTATGARTNVVVTGLNLITDSGAAEFVTYNLTGVYSDLNGASSKQHAIEYYSNNNTIGWTRERESNVVVSENSGGLNDDGDDAYYGANVRFKIADGYGSPYYMYTDTSGKAIKNETSLSGVANGFPDPTTANDVVNFSKVKAEIEGISNGTVEERTLTDSTNKILSQYIYYDDISGDGYYYFHITRPADNVTPKICLLTVVAKTVKYTVRYTSSYDPKNPQKFNPETETAWYGFIQDRSTGELTPMPYGKKAPNDKVFKLDAKSMPETIHDRVTCELVNMIDPKERDKWWDILHQYDDNGGNFYDMIYNTKASIASNSYGTIRPKDVNNGYSFVAWVLVNEKFEPYLDENEDYIYFTGGILDLNIYADYAVKHSAFGTDDVDLHVFRLMPVWKANNNPYSYNVVLNWVDAKGTLNQIEFSDWDDVVTEAQDGEQLFVFLNKDSIPLKNWIASHPTYIFWDEVNNAVTQFKKDANGNLILDENGNPQRDRDANTKILKEALEVYLQREYNPAQYPQDALILQALVNRDYTGYDADGEQTKPGYWKKDEIGSHIKDPVTGASIWVPYKYEPGGNGVDDFDRLDGNIFRVNENGGTISIWMYETKGGLIFKKDVEVEPFTGDDEFYFSIINNWVGEETKDKDGNVITPTARLGTVEEPAIYKAYPMTVYNEKEGTWGFYDKKSGKFTPATDEDSWLVTFVDGEIVSIEQHGELLVERDGEGQPILDDHGNPILITYFTLVDEQGIALYVPNGNYTVVETGSKSGGSYQAEVKYKDESNNEISGRVELPTTKKDENGNDIGLWLKGTNRHYIHLEDGEEFDKDDYEGVSQIPATVTFLTGEKELIQTLIFYNKTNSLSVGMDLAQNVYDKYPKNGTQTAKDTWNTTYNGDYDFAVVFALPTGQTPIERTQSTRLSRSTATYATGETYYFNMNVYSDFDSDDKEFVRLVEVEFRRYNPIYDENFNKDPDRNPWGITTKNYDNLWIGHFTLQPGETGALVMQVLVGNVNYWVDEPGVEEANNSALSNGLRPLWDAINGKQGTAVVGQENRAHVLNSWIQPDFGYLKITVDGGESTESFLFNIIGEAISGVQVSLTVSVKGNGSTYVYIPTGIYKVTPNAWSWRYDLEMVNPPPELYVGPNNMFENPLVVTFKAENNDKGWLGGESSSNKRLS